MNIPTRLLVMQRLQKLLETTYDVDGRIIDTTGRVTRNRNLTGEEVKDDALSILEAPRPDFAVFAGEGEGWRKDNLTILIQGRVLDDKLQPGDNGYWFAAAVEQRLCRITEEKSQGREGGMYPEHYMLGGTITKLEIAPPVVRPPEDKVSAMAFFFLAVRLGIAVKIGEPYTSVL